MKHHRTIFAVLAALLILGFIPLKAAGQSDSLVNAYQKEFAYLEAEKANLKKRLGEQEKIAATQIQQAKAELGALQSKLLWSNSEADRLEELLSDSEREAEALYENADTLDATVSQAATTLSQYGVELPEEGSEAEPDVQKRLGFLVDRSVSALYDLGCVRKMDGEFFLTNGSKVAGEIFRIGNVAALGISSDQSGVLAPAGDHRYKIWPSESEASAKALAAGNRPDTMPMFLYESLEKAIDQKAEKSVVDVIQSGGVIGWIIVCLGFGALLMVALRGLFLYQAASKTDGLLADVSPLVEQGKCKEALQVCRSGKGATARVLQATIRNLDRDREHLEDIISESILHETPFLDRFGSSILVFAAVAPLLGLLGTVTGMISTFDVITEFGTGDPKLLSGGISEALVTTELGLIVAIPSLLLGNLLSGWSEKIKAGMENAALSITNISLSARQGNLFQHGKVGNAADDR